MAKNHSVENKELLIDELHKVHKLGVSEMARLLEKSKGRVSMRLGLMEQMSDVVMEKIFNGQYPVYSYMYTLRPFIRMNGIKKAEIEDFVCSTSGKGLSVRDLDTLARGYFSGSADFVEQIKKGDISWVLNHLKEKEAMAGSSDCSELERKVLRELEIIRCYMDKIPFYSSDSRLKSPDYCAQANLAAGKLLKNIPAFKQYLEALYDRTREKGCSISASS